MGEVECNLLERKHIDRCLPLQTEDKLINEDEYFKERCYLYKGY